MTKDQYLEQITSFILNVATESELDVLDAAIKRRGRVNSPDDLNFTNLAQNLLDRFDFEMPDFHNMSRDMIKNIILENIQEISVHDLNILLDHYAPSAQKRSENEKEIPPEMLQSMIKQFISFSIGKMEKSEDIELRKSIPNWPENYWNVFSIETRNWIKKTIAEVSNSGQS